MKIQQKSDERIICGKFKKNAKTNKLISFLTKFILLKVTTGTYLDNILTSLNLNTFCDGL
jgi:hypothetical protein